MDILFCKGLPNREEKQVIAVKISADATQICVSSRTNFNSKPLKKLNFSCEIRQGKLDQSNQKLKLTCVDFNFLWSNNIDNDPHPNILHPSLPRKVTFGV